ncbi:UNVERIFIED_ORG: hypothetical protein ABIB19_001694 [Arthrobacter sp. UYEF10]
MPQRRHAAVEPFETAGMGGDLAADVVASCARLDDEFLARQCGNVEDVGVL